MNDEINKFIKARIQVRFTAHVKEEISCIFLSFLFIDFRLRSEHYQA
jgi:hypothetical protein